MSIVLGPWVGKRQGIAAVMLMMGAVLAFGSLAIGVQGAKAHHNEYHAERLCDGTWTAAGVYVGGENERLVIVDSLVMNGVPFDPSWSGGMLEPYDPAVHGPVTSEVGSPAYAWRGTSAGFTLFDRSGGGFAGGAANWSGTLHVFGPDQDKAGMWTMTREPLSVWEPEGPTDCTTQTSFEPATGTPVQTVAEVRTASPAAPSAGMGLDGDVSSTNVLFALLGLLALSGGAALLALGRTPADD